MISCCPFAKHCECMVLIGVFIVTHLSFKESQQKKWRSLGLTCSKHCTKQTVIFVVVLAYFHKLVCIMKTKGHCSGNSPFFKRGLKNTLGKN